MEDHSGCERKSCNKCKCSQYRRRESSHNCARCDHVSRDHQTVLWTRCLLSECPCEEFKTGHNIPTCYNCQHHVNHHGVPKVCRQVTIQSAANDQVPLANFQPDAMLNVNAGHSLDSASDSGDGDDCAGQSASPSSNSTDNAPPLTSHSSTCSPGSGDLEARSTLALGDGHVNSCAITSPTLQCLPPSQLNSLRPASELDQPGLTSSCKEGIHTSANEATPGSVQTGLPQDRTVASDDRTNTPAIVLCLPELNGRPSPEFRGLNTGDFGLAKSLAMTCSNQQCDNVSTPRFSAEGEYTTSSDSSYASAMECIQSSRSESRSTENYDSDNKNSMEARPAIASASLQENQQVERSTKGEPSVGETRLMEQCPNLVSSLDAPAQSINVKILVQPVATRPTRRATVASTSIQPEDPRHGRKSVPGGQHSTRLPLANNRQRTSSDIRPRSLSAAQYGSDTIESSSGETYPATVTARRMGNRDRLPLFSLGALSMPPTMGDPESVNRTTETIPLLTIRQETVPETISRSDDDSPASDTTAYMGDQSSSLATEVNEASDSLPEAGDVPFRRLAKDVNASSLSGAQTRHDVVGLPIMSTPVQSNAPGKPTISMSCPPLVAHQNSHEQTATIRSSWSAVDQLSFSSSGSSTGRRVQLPSVRAERNSQPKSSKTCTLASLAAAEDTSYLGLDACADINPTESDEHDLSDSNSLAPIVTYSSFSSQSQDNEQEMQRPRQLDSSAQIHGGNGCNLLAEHTIPQFTNGFPSSSPNGQKNTQHSTQLSTYEVPRALCGDRYPGSTVSGSGSSSLPMSSSQPYSFDDHSGDAEPQPYTDDSSMEVHLYKRGIFDDPLQPQSILLSQLGDASVGGAISNEATSDGMDSPHSPSILKQSSSWRNPTENGCLQPDEEAEAFRDGEAGTPSLSTKLSFNTGHVKNQSNSSSLTPHRATLSTHHSQNGKRKKRKKTDQPHDDSKSATASKKAKEPVRFTLSERHKKEKKKKEIKKAEARLESKSTHPKSVSELSKPAAASATATESGAGGLSNNNQHNGSPFSFLAGNDERASSPTGHTSDETTLSIDDDVSDSYKDETDTEDESYRPGKTEFKWKLKRGPMAYAGKRPIDRKPCNAKAKGRKQKQKRKLHCGKCDNCKKPNCGECVNCKNPNRRKACTERSCLRAASGH